MTDPYRPPQAEQLSLHLRLPWLKIALGYGIPGSALSVGGALLWSLQDLCAFDSARQAVSPEAFWLIASASSVLVPLAVYAAVGARGWTHALGRAVMGTGSVVLAVVLTYVLAEGIEALAGGTPLARALVDGMLQGTVLGTFLSVVGLIPGLLIRPP